MLDAALMLLLPIMAVVNASISVGNSQIDVPFSVQPLNTPDPSLQQGITPTAQQPAAGPQVAGITLDPAQLTGLVTAIGAVLTGIGFKITKDSRKEDRRDNMVAETSFKQVMSQKETDKGVMELANFQLRLAKKSGDAELIAEAQRLAKEHCSDFHAYYENIQPEPLDYDKDQVIKKLSAVQKRTEPQ